MNDSIADCYSLKALKVAPHVVILGAGASLATIPNGDKYGKCLSAMDGFMERFGLFEFLKGIKLNASNDNIEDVYSEIAERSELVNIRIAIENCIWREMSSFQIPDSPTVYDFLLLSLRKKDAIATFNWDPLLLQAYERVVSITEDLPALYFLHGNVMQGRCECGKHVIGSYGGVCSQCGNRLMHVPLLYPVKNKDYNSKWWIEGAWHDFHEYMKRAGALTIFGYSAPKSDAAAVKLLKEGWGFAERKPTVWVEVIDLKKEGELFSCWKDFTFNAHFSACKSFFDSRIAKSPRRTVESYVEQHLCNKFLSFEKSAVTSEMSFKEIGRHLKPLLMSE